MSISNISLEVQDRTSSGKSSSRRLRKLTQVPAILYGGKKEPHNISLAANKLRKIMENEDFYSQIIELVLPNGKQQAVLKAVHRHPYKKEVLHLDFQRVSITDKITAHVPLHFINEKDSPAIKAGAIISHHVVELEIRAQAQYIPRFIEVDLAQLDVGGIIHLNEIVVDKGLEILTLVRDTEAGKQAVASAHMPRSAIEDESSNSTVAAGDVEVISSKESKESKENKDSKEKSENKKN